MSDNQSNNKRIAKNTLFMYMRMLFQLCISLYTSRVILQALGVENFGIQNVVGGVVVLFSFVNTALTTGTQRHISYELGKSDTNVPKIFTACFNVHLIIAALIFILSETIGLWFLNTQMNFPEGREYAANVVYQISLLCCIIGVIQTPYASSVVAYERMSFYAYFGIIDSILKLAICYLLLEVQSVDTLILYNYLHLGVVFLMFAAISFYSHKKLEDVKFIKIKEKEIYKHIFTFSGWTLFGSIATLMETQGLNILINMFYGVTVNAAVGVSNQVRNALNQFVAGFQQALNPQLVMSQSSGDRERQYDLIYKSSKFSFFILFVLALPVMVNLDCILSLWLGTVPNYTSEICRLAIIFQLIEAIASPLFTTIFAVGNIKRYQVVVFCFRFCSLLLGLIICKLGFEPYVIYVVPILVGLVLLIYRIIYTQKQIDMSFINYTKKVITPIVLTTFVILPPVLWYKYISNEINSIVQLLVQSGVLVILSTILVFVLGLSQSEKIMIINIVKNKIHK